MCYIKNKSLKCKVIEFKCIICQFDHIMPYNNDFPICEIIMDLLEKKSSHVYRGQSVEQLNSNLDLINHELNQIKCDLNNPIDNIKEYCMNLRTQVQLSAESIILEISKLNEALVTKINCYENDLLENVKSNIHEISSHFEKPLKEIDEFHKKYSSYLSRSQINEQEVINANYLAVEVINKLKIEKFRLEDHLFNDKLLKFNSNLPNLTYDFIGALQIHNTRVSIHLNDLRQVNVRNLIVDLHQSAEDSVFVEVFDDGTLFILFKKMNRDFKYFTLNEVKSREQYLYITNGEILNLKKTQNLIALNYIYGGQTFIKILNQKLEHLHTENLTKKFSYSLELIGASDKHYYFISQNSNNHIFIFNMEMSLVKTFGNANDPEAKFHIPWRIKQLEYTNGLYIWLDNRCLNFVDKLSGQLIKCIEISADSFELDKNNNIVVFSDTNKRLFYFDLKGDLLREVTLSNFDSTKAFNFFLNKFENKLYFFDKQNLVILN